MKYTPETHKTRCGAPWWPVVDEYIRVKSNSGLWVIGTVNSSGQFTEYFDRRLKIYDLIPIPKEHNLPTDLPIAAQWVAKDLDGKVYAHSSPCTWEQVGKFWVPRPCGGKHYLTPWLYGGRMLADYPPEDSLHKRTGDGGWEWVPKDGGHG